MNRNVSDVHTASIVSVSTLKMETVFPFETFVSTTQLGSKANNDN
jgi:hypothetical protein